MPEQHERPEVCAASWEICRYTAYCGLPKGHDGYHLERKVDKRVGLVLTFWLQEETDRHDLPLL